VALLFLGAKPFLRFTVYDGLARSEIRPLAIGASVSAPTPPQSRTQTTAGGSGVGYQRRIQSIIDLFEDHSTIQPERSPIGFFGMALRFGGGPRYSMPTRNYQCDINSTHPGHSRPAVFLLPAGFTLPRRGRPSRGLTGISVFCRSATPLGPAFAGGLARKRAFWGDYPLAGQCHRVEGSAQLHFSRSGPVATSPVFQKLPPARADLKLPDVVSWQALSRRLRPQVFLRCCTSSVGQLGRRQETANRARPTGFCFGNDPAGNSGRDWFGGEVSGATLPLFLFPRPELDLAEGFRLDPDARSQSVSGQAPAPGFGCR